MLTHIAAFLPVGLAVLAVVIKFGVQKVEPGKVKTKVFRIAPESSAWPSFQTFVEDCQRRFSSSEPIVLHYVDGKQRAIECETDDDLHGFLEDADDANKDKDELTLTIVAAADRSLVPEVALEPGGGALWQPPSVNSSPTSLVSQHTPDASQHLRQGSCNQADRSARSQAHLLQKISVDLKRVRSDAVESLRSAGVDVSDEVFRAERSGDRGVYYSASLPPVDHEEPAWDRQSIGPQKGASTRQETCDQRGDKLIRPAEQSSTLAKETSQPILGRYIFLCLAYALVLVPSAMMAAFFDEAAADRGLTGSGLVGLIYGSKDISGLVWTFFFAQMLTWYPKFFKRRNLLIGGMGIGSLATSLFALAAIVHSKIPFLVVCLLLRILHGVGTSIVIQVVYSSMATLFHAKGNQMGTAMGGMDAIGSIGWIGSPSLGGVLYTLGGFYLPFVVVGGCMLLWCVMAVVMECCGVKLVPEAANASSEVTEAAEVQEESSALMPAPTMFVGLKNWRIVLLMLACALGTTGTAFVNPILGPFLASKGLSESFRGTFFLYAALSYAICGVLAGLLADRVLGHWRTVLIGIFLQFVTFALLGPLPFFPDGTTYWLAAPGMLCLGAGTAFAFAPVLPLMLDVGVATTGYSAAELGEVMTGLYLAAYYIPSGFVPIISDALAKTIGYRKACLVPTVVNLAAFIFMALICDDVLHQRKGKRSAKVAGSGDAAAA